MILEGDFCTFHFVHPVSLWSRLWKWKRRLCDSTMHLNLYQHLNVPELSLHVFACYDQQPKKETLQTIEVKNRLLVSMVFDSTAINVSNHHLCHQINLTLVLLKSASLQTFAKSCILVSVFGIFASTAIFVAHPITYNIYEPYIRHLRLVVPLYFSVKLDNYNELILSIHLSSSQQQRNKDEWSSTFHSCKALHKWLK